MLAGILIIHPKANIEEGVTIGTQCHIGSDARIFAPTVIGDGSMIDYRGTACGTCRCCPIVTLETGPRCVTPSSHPKASSICMETSGAFLTRLLSVDPAPIKAAAQVCPTNLLSEIETESVKTLWFHASVIYQHENVFEALGARIEI